ncbi:MAG: alpha/beta hydrolase, partial [Sphingopyxis sp.]|nr:alpha/beta hydrolase [Sphingopyxis sp.]
WRLLPAAPALGAAPVAVPALPGFTASLPPGFSATKEAYADWAVGQAEALFAQHGPIDIIGHDWGALIAQRTAMLRPDLFRSWAVSNAVIDPDYRGHRLARIWNTPILGELFMALSKPAKLADGLAAQGMPADIAEEEAAQWALKDKRRAILKLYRSAKGLSFEHDWARDIGKLPANGALVWGEGDPYVELSVAQRFSSRTGTPLTVIESAGHWAIAERPDAVAAALHSFWNGL